MLYLLGTNKKGIALLTWTITEDKPQLIFVRAVINTEYQQDQLRNLIEALQKRITKPKEITDERDA